VEMMLGEQENGRPKAFRPEAIESFRNLIQGYRELSLGSQAGMDLLMEKAEAIVSGDIDPLILKQDGVRQIVGQQFETLRTELEGLLVARPVRNIRFRQESQAEASDEEE
jgi:hypothetical protein